MAAGLATRRTVRAGGALGALEFFLIGLGDDEGVAAVGGEGGGGSVALSEAPATASATRGTALRAEGAGGVVRAADVADGDAVFGGAGGCPDHELTVADLGAQGVGGPFPIVR